jgi:serine/threonine protein kinase
VIIDFGSAVGALRGPVERSVGTLFWRPPEAFRSSNATEWSCKTLLTEDKLDIYSFGIILWELLHLPRHPWEGTLDVKRAVLAGYRPTNDKSLPKTMRGFLKKLWSSEADDRPDFDQILDFLKEYAKEIAPKNENVPSKLEGELLKLSETLLRQSEQLERLFERRAVATAEPPVCATCTKPIESAHTQVGARHYHQTCLKCGTCDLTIHSGVFWFVNRKPTCQDCFHS